MKVASAGCVGLALKPESAQKEEDVITYTYPEYHLRAHVIEDAREGSLIKCKVNGKVEMVHCSIYGGDDLNEAVPRLQKGDCLIVDRKKGRIRRVQPFLASVDYC